MLAIGPFFFDNLPYFHLFDLDFGENFNVKLTQLYVNKVLMLFLCHYYLMIVQVCMDLTALIQTLQPAQCFILVIIFATFTLK